MEEVTHSYTFEWACINDLCVNRFCPTFEELVHPDLLIIYGQPDCYRCHQRRTMTQVGNQVRFDCPNPRCNEVLRLIVTKAAQAVKARAAAALDKLNAEPEPPRVEPSASAWAHFTVSHVEPHETNGRGLKRIRTEELDRPRHLHALPPLPPN
ncbi:hypothetical protein D6T64_03915 [Cryobacterium melibiosiphilum]|uniref:Uncharacterized protein n=2 Tax=Cryobacterium melibiosiphilum TaxID=995039 RepID=A0A3A5MJV9_9MICO|nr:hypothetical protein D6T64_03915 [Cryobacterium melibiosiphilum]